MGLEENRHATEVRLRLLNPPNAVPDQGIDLKRQRPQLPPEPPAEEMPPPPESPPPPSNILLFRPRDLTVMHVIELVAKHSQISAADLLGDSRKAAFSFPRHIAFWLTIKHFPKRTLTRLAMTFNKDHTSLIHGRDRMNRYLGSECPEGVRIRKIIALVEADIYDRSRNDQMVSL